MILSIVNCSPFCEISSMYLYNNTYNTIILQAVVYALYAYNILYLYKNVNTHRMVLDSENKQVVIAS